MGAWLPVLAAASLLAAPTPEARMEVSEDSTPWEGRIGAAAVLPGALNPMGAVRLSLRKGLPVGLTLGVVVEGSVFGTQRMVISEPVAAMQLWLPVYDGEHVRVSAGMELGVLVHVLGGDLPLAVHADGRFGVGIDVHYRPWAVGLEVMPTLRSIEVRHLLAGRAAFDARLWGLLVGGYWQWEA